MIANEQQAFDDLVFEQRNKEYGAYELRKAYKSHITISVIIGIILLVMATGIPFIMASVNKNKIALIDPVFEGVMEDIKNKEEVLPPPPPPPPIENLEKQLKYLPPVVVDSVVDVQIKITEENVEETNDDGILSEVVEPEATKVIEDEKEPDIFIVVEEMPTFPGGTEQMNRFLMETIKYPEIAKENGIEGKVFVRFCVTDKGKVNQVTIARGVDPLLDAEAIRVVKLLPDWTPGKQSGKAVNVWYTVPINFQLQ